jgi:tRNA threonylcarbamoyladenosine biosynthesis protein TsaB
MLLAINTSTTQFGIAVLERDGKIVAEYVMSKQKRHFSGFLPAFAFVLQSSQISLEAFEAVVVAKGPGSFTGLRVGLSFAKGLCHSLKLPIIGVSTLDALASQLVYPTLPIVALLDSRKDEVFAASYRWDAQHRLVRTSRDSCKRLDDLPSFVAEPSIFIGTRFETQANRIERAFGKAALLAPSHLWVLKPSAVGIRGLIRLSAGDFDDLQELKPAYHRPPDIRPNPYPLRPNV